MADKKYRVVASHGRHTVTLLRTASVMAAVRCAARALMGGRALKIDTPGATVTIGRHSYAARLAMRAEPRSGSSARLAQREIRRLIEEAGRVRAVAQTPRPWSVSDALHQAAHLDD